MAAAVAAAVAAGLAAAAVLVPSGCLGLKSWSLSICYTTDSMILMKSQPNREGVSNLWPTGLLEGLRQAGVGPAGKILGKVPLEDAASGTQASNGCVNPHHRSLATVCKDPPIDWIWPRVQGEFDIPVLETFMHA